jgi:hypothetical protein
MRACFITLARTLLEFCSLVNCLIIDEDGVYDPKLVKINSWISCS